MTEHDEIEQKFEVDEDFERPDFGGADDRADDRADGHPGIPGLSGVSADAPVTHHLSATYYDTQDQRLANAKITLRRRTGGTDEGWHLKLPGGADSRREVHAPLSDDLPDALAARVAEVTAGAALRPIAILDTERTVVTVHRGSAAVAEIADDVVTARRLGPGGPGGTDSGPELRWREVEVEVPERDPALQEAVAEQLLAAGARRASRASKLARVLES
jgi:inorganic triphosphatase YgiF